MADNQFAISYINVPVAVEWKDANLPREIDHLILNELPDIKAWIESMSYDEKLWLVGKVETQALLGTKVIILEETTDWEKIAIPSQPTNNEPLGYPGWVPKNLRD